MAWANKTKINDGTWSHKARIPTMIERGRILTPDGNQVLVGAGKNEVLIWQAASDDWTRKSKLTGSWTNKIKIAA